ncbi:DUF2726 domain-containing protein [Paraburkholderia sp. EG286B]|uniref:DUF2726 domain-containing protein n=1 Tax=Paraburkholderia sp. EG286B TaxID=3237011 RepID=UPI0034D159DF
MVHNLRCFDRTVKHSDTIQSRGSASAFATAQAAVHAAADPDCYLPPAQTAATRRVHLPAGCHVRTDHAEVEGKARQGKASLADFRLISQKRVDFAVYTAGLELLAVVELDDRTHNRAGRKARCISGNCGYSHRAFPVAEQARRAREIRVALFSPR